MYTDKEKKFLEYCKNIIRLKNSGKITEEQATYDIVGAEDFNSNSPEINAIFDATADRIKNGEWQKIIAAVEKAQNRLESLTVSQIYNKYKIPPMLQTHMLRVGAVAELICDNLTVPVNKKVVVAASLLHDMGNILKFKWGVLPEAHEPEGLEYWQNVQEEFRQKYGDDEHIATLKIIEELQTNPVVLELVKSMGFKNACNYLEQTYEQKICGYADQRVAPYGVVPMIERFDEGKSRYGRIKSPNPESPRWIECFKQLEKQIFEKSSIRPEDISNKTIDPILEQRLYEVL